MSHVDDPDSEQDIVIKFTRDCQIEKKVEKPIRFPRVDQCLSCYLLLVIGQLLFMYGAVHTTGRHN